MSFLHKTKDKLKITPLGVAILKFRRNHKARSKADAYRAMELFGYDDWSEDEKDLCYRDMVLCSQKYHFDFNEYFQLNLMQKSDDERQEFVSDSDRVKLCEDFNNPHNQIIFDNKSLTAETFAKYFRRDYVCFENEKDIDDVKSFLEKHSNFIVKPEAGASGKGVKILSTQADLDKQAREIISNYSSALFGGGIIEELICQDQRMKALHPQSVNTIRVPTIKLDDRIVIFHPILRIGQGTSVVDNTGAGGIICALDPENGTVLAARDRNGHAYFENPNNGEVLVGFQVPEWDRAVKLVKDLAMVVPDNRYTGWDIALAEDGWILVEANARGQWGSQIAMQRGWRKEIEGYRKELGLPSIKHS